MNTLQQKFEGPHMLYLSYFASHSTHLHEANVDFARDTVCVAGWTCWL